MVHKRQLSLVATLPALSAAQFYSAGEVIPLSIDGTLTLVTLPYYVAPSATNTEPVTYTLTPEVTPVVSETPSSKAFSTDFLKDKG